MKQTRTLIIAAACALLSGSPSAFAQKRNTFATVQSFRSCQETWAFACGKIDASGHRYGTAHKRTLCSTYTFLPDGTAKLGVYPGLWERGRYRIHGGIVHIDVLDEKGKITSSSDLRLSGDSTMLGDMTRVAPGQ